MIIEQTVNLGDLLGGIAAISVAIVAWVTLYLVDMKTNDRAWYESFKALYSEFWNDPDLLKVRTWIATEPGYADFLPVVQKRLSTYENLLTAEEYRRLDELDRFCSIIIRINLFGQQKMTTRQRILYERTFESYWLKKMRSRTEMASYIKWLWGDYFFENVPVGDAVSRVFVTSDP